LCDRCVDGTVPSHSALSASAQLSQLSPTAHQDTGLTKATSTQRLAVKVTLMAHIAKTAREAALVCSDCAHVVRTLFLAFAIVGRLTTPQSLVLRCIMSNEAGVRSIVRDTRTVRRWHHASQPREWTLRGRRSGFRARVRDGGGSRRASCGTGQCAPQPLEKRYDLFARVRPFHCRSLSTIMLIGARRLFVVPAVGAGARLRPEVVRRSRRQHEQRNHEAAYSDHG